MRPTRIWLVRHAESIEDINPSLHNLTKDSLIGLTKRGVDQAREVQKILKKGVGLSSSLRVYLSPSNRAGETWKYVKEAFPEAVVSTDERIRNLNWGNINAENKRRIEKERYKAGVLYYNFPGGDRTPEYVSNINNFVSELLEEAQGCREQGHILILTHGFALRVLAKVLLGLSDDEFRWLANPPNTFVAEIEPCMPGFRITTPLPKVKHFVDVT